MLKLEQKENMIQAQLVMPPILLPVVEIDLDLTTEGRVTKEDWKKLAEEDKLDALYDLLGEVNATANQALNNISGLTQGMHMLNYRIGKIEKCLKDKGIME